tara:strand:+ start:1097 stop:1822 length:726 start_codon:yes stop_codon:yes gene_type:complete
MKVLVTGGSGLLGGYIQKELKDRKIEYFAPESHVMNITDELQVSRTISDFKPDVVIHCAAVAKYKIVEEQPMKALRANVLGTINIIAACSTLSNLGFRNKTPKIVYISTDHVFDGEDGNYSTADRINPQTKYAKMKAAGELCVRTYPNHLSIRTSFCPEEFPFDTAYTDKWSSQDYVDLIAPKIVDAALSKKTDVVNIGHKRRSFYELALERKPDVKKGSVESIVNTSPVPILIDTSLEVE